MQPTSAELDGLLSFATSIAREVSSRGQRDALESVLAERSKAGGMIKDGQEKRLQQESTQQDLKTSSVDVSFIPPSSVIGWRSTVKLMGYGIWAERKSAEGY